MVVTGDAAQLRNGGAFKWRGMGRCGGPVDPRARKSDKIPGDLDGWMGLQQDDPREGWFSQSGASKKAERNRASAALFTPKNQDLGLNINENKN